MAKLPFDDPEVKNVIDTALGVLVAESDRGAALVATELINNLLEQFIKDISPHDFKSSTLLEYPGPLSGLASRTDALYAFRLIGKNVYRVISLIRKMRNDAAHSFSDFSLDGQKNRLQEAYSELVYPWNSIDHVATELIVHKLFQWVHADRDGTWHEMYEQGIFSGPDEVVKEIVNRQKSQLLGHIPRFRLAVAVGVLCALIVFQKNELLATLDGKGLLLHGFRQNKDK